MKQKNKNEGKGVERRKATRIEKKLSITLKGDAVTQVTETKNISGSGTFCQVSQPIPELSKLEVTLFVPVMGGKKTDLEKIDCTGVVVRSEKIIRGDGAPEKFFIAIYFTNVRPGDRNTLDRYIAYQLAQETA